METEVMREFRLAIEQTMRELIERAMAAEARAEVLSREVEKLKGRARSGRA